MNIDLVTIVVPDYESAIDFFVGNLGFDLIEDVPATANDGRPKRWVVVRPPDGHTGLLLARADGDRQVDAVGNQTGGRVTFFLNVDHFDSAFQTMRAKGVRFVKEPRMESYGKVAVFLDPWGNKWDLLGP